MARIRVGNRTVRSIFRRGADDVQVSFDPDDKGMYPAPWYREAAQPGARRLLDECQRCLDARRDEWDTLLEPVGNPHKLGLWRLDYDGVTDPDRVVAAQYGVDTYGLVVRDGLVRAVIWEGDPRDIPALRSVTIHTQGHREVSRAWHASIGRYGWNFPGVATLFLARDVALARRRENGRMALRHGMKARLIVIALVGLLLALAGCSRARAPDGTTTATAVTGAGTATRDRIERATATVATEPPADFAFVYVSAACSESKAVDTFSGTFTVFVPQDGRYHGGTRTIPFALMPAETRAVYRQMAAMDFFTYPPMLKTSSPRQVAPASNYDFRVRRDGLEYTFHWTDTTTPTPSGMERDLATLTRLLSDILYAHPEAQAVPTGVGCT